MTSVLRPTMADQRPASGTASAACCSTLGAPQTRPGIHLVEEIADREALTVVWYDEVDWKDESDHLPRR